MYCLQKLFNHSFCRQTLLSLRIRTLRSTQWKKNNGGKKEARVFKLFFVAFVQHCLTWVPDHCTTKSVSFKNSSVFCLSLQNWNFETILHVGRWKFLSSIEKQTMVYIQPLSLQTSNFKESKTTQTGFEEISKTSINKAPFLLFSHAFVTLSSYRVPMFTIILGKMIWTCFPLLVEIGAVNGRGFWGLLWWLCKFSRSWVLDLHLAEIHRKNKVAGANELIFVWK